MKTLEELYKDLELYKDFDADPENSEKFLEAVDEIVLRKDPSSIAVLLKYFDDDSEYSWIIEEMKGAIEHYDSQNYVVEVLKTLKKLCVYGNEWALGLLYVILNTDDCLLIFRQHMHLADKNSLLKLFDIMEHESPHHAALIQDLRKELNEKK
jgi:hypothetical protein